MTDIEVRTSNAIAENITYYLNYYKMSRSELARRLNVSPQAVGYWCTGKKIPRMPQIDKMCEIFNVTRSQLVSKKVPSVAIVRGKRVIAARPDSRLPKRKMSDFAIDPAMTFSGMVQRQHQPGLSQEEQHLITLYREGKYKEIVNLMMEKM